MNKKALIFYISRYSGHYTAAKAIQQALLKTRGDTEIRVINAFDYTNPILGKIITRAHLEVVKKKPSFWGSIYDNPEILEKIKKVRDVFYKYNLPKIRRLMESFSPDIVYCTQAYPCGMVAEYKKLSASDVPLVGVLTDHAPHSYWLFDEVDIYVVPSSDTARALESKGVPAEKIRTYGIPIDSRFARSCDRASILKKIDIAPDKPVVLVMGGNQGLGEMEEIVEALLNGSSSACQVIAVTGKNKKLYRKLKKSFPASPGGSLKLYSYIANIEEFMEVSDVLITKAGGITTAEALAKKLPLLIINPIPGQERMNTDFLVREGAAMEITDPKEIPAVVDRLFNGGDALDRMRRGAEKVSRPDSALKIAELTGGPDL